MRRPRTALIAAVLAAVALSASILQAQMFGRRSARDRAQPATGSPAPTPAADYNPMLAARGARQLLRNGLDYLDTYGDAERALTYLREASARSSELSPTEVKQLRDGMERATQFLASARGPEDESGVTAVPTSAQTFAPEPAIRRVGAEAELPALPDDVPPLPDAPAAPALDPTAPAPTPFPGSSAPETPAPASPSPAQEAPTAPAPAGAEPIGLTVLSDPSDHMAAPAPAQAAPAPPVAPAPLAAPAQEGGVPDLPAVLPAPSDESMPPPPLPAPGAGLEDAPPPIGPIGEPTPEAAAPSPEPDRQALGLETLATPPAPAGGQPDLSLPGTQPAPEAPATGDPLALPAPADAPAFPGPIGSAPAFDPGAAAPAPIDPAAAMPTPEAEPAAPPGADVPGIDLSRLTTDEPDVNGNPTARPAMPGGAPGPRPAPMPEMIRNAGARPRMGAAPSADEDLPPLPPEADALPTTPPPAPTGSPTPLAMNDPSLPPSISTLRPESRREIEEIARRQDAELRSNPRQYDPNVPMNRPYGEADVSSNRVSIPRAPAPTEVRPIKPIPLPEEFEPLGPRIFEPQRKYWSAAATCHTKLYFQDAVLERYGQSVEQAMGPAGRCFSYPLDDPRQSTQRMQLLQPLYSTGMFALQLAAWPYNLIVDPPGEAEYDLGYYRPGDPIPPDSYFLPHHGVGPPLHGKRY